MADLTNRSVASSYKELLKTSSANGVTNDLTVVEDGDATASALQVSSAGIKSSGFLQADGSTSLGSTLSVTGNVSTQGDISAAGNLTVTGNAVTQGGLDVGGNLLVSGSAVIQGLLTANGGNITLGDNDSDNLVFGADVNSNILPNVNDTFDLGSDAKKWRDLNLSGTASVGGNLTVASTTDSTNKDTGALVLEGGLGVEKSATIGANLTVVGDVAVNGGDLTTSQTTFNLLNTTATTVNFAGSTSLASLNIGSGVPAANTTKAVNIGTGGVSNSTTNIAIGNSFGGTTTIHSPTVVGSSTTQNLFNSTATTLNIGGAATNLNLGATTGTTSVKNNLAVSGNLTVSGTTTTIDSSTLTVDDKNIELGSVVSATISTTGTVGSITGSGPWTATVSGMTSTAGLIVGSRIAATNSGGSLGGGGGTFTVASIIDATSITYTATGGTTPVAGNLTNITTTGATDTTANLGGITLKGTTDKTLQWESAGSNWTSSENFNLVSAKTYKINNTEVLSSTGLGTNVISSSLTSVATISTGTWQGSVVAGQYGGTGVSNSGKSITLGGNLTTTGAHTTNLTTTGNTSVTLPTSGTLATVGGNLGTASATSLALTNDLAVSDGGTGASTFTQNGVLLGNATNAISATSAGTNGQLLVGQTNAAPIFQTMSGDASISSTGTLTISGGAIDNNKVASNAAIAFSKLANVSATDRLLGRSTAGAGAIEEITCTAAGRALIDDADSAAQRATLGLGTLATQSGTFSGTSSGTNTGDQTITLTGDVTGSGTGSFAATIGANKVDFSKFQTVAGLSVVGVSGSTTANTGAITAGTDKQVLRRNGTTLGFGAIDLASSDAVSGTLAISNGGTGVTSTPTNGQLLIGNGSGFSLATLSAGANITITNAAGTVTIAATGGGGGGGGSEFGDDVFRINDDADSSKKLAFQCSGITAGNTRTLTVPDANGTIVLNDNAVTLTNKTLTTPVLSATASGTTAGRLGYVSGALSYGDGVNQRTVVNTDEAQTLSNKTFTSPSLGAATATSINKLTITQPATSATLTVAEGKTLKADNSLTLSGTDNANVAFGGGGTVSYTGNKLSVFSSTTSSELAGVISDETGTGALVFANSPTLVTPTLGAATATSVNKLAITQPATSATLTILDGKTLKADNTLTFTGTDSSSVAFGGGGTVAYLGTAQEYTSTHNFNATLLSLGAGTPAPIAWALNTNQVTSVTLTAAATLSNPTGQVDGAVYILEVKQDGTGNRTLSFDTAYKFPGGTAPTLTMGANKVDILTFISDGTNMFGVSSLNYL